MIYVENPLASFNPPMDPIAFRMGTGLGIYFGMKSGSGFNLGKFTGWYLLGEWSLRVCWVRPYMHARFLYIRSRRREDCVWTAAEGIVSVKLKSDKQLARVATNLAIGVVGLIAVRIITQFLPMFHDAGWIVEDKLTVQGGAVIAVDALLLFVLVRFAIEIRSYLVLRFPTISSLGNMAASLVCLVITVIAYTDFKPVTHAWPDFTNLYLWTFFAIAVAFLIGIVVLIFRDRDSIAAMILRQPMPPGPSKQSAGAEDSAAAAAGS